MAADEPSGARPPVVLRIKLRYEDLDTMVQRFAPNVGKSGLFLPTKSVQPAGTEVKFELRLADDTAVLVGLGRVRASRALDPANPKIAFGMAVELLRVNREGRDLILKMLERRRQIGLPEVALPMPEDVDAARRHEVDTTSVRDTVSTAVPPPLVTMEQPVDTLMTAPRKSTGSIGVAKDMSVKALAPEPARRKRPLVMELIASAQSGPVAAVTTLDDEVDLKAALIRARVLVAGTDVDAELDALLEVSAAPLEISIEAASAELARQLGGKAVDRRDRSARWAPPPATVPAPEPAPPTPAEPVAPVAVEAAVHEPEAAAHIAVHEPEAVAPIVVHEPEVEVPAFTQHVTEIDAHDDADGTGFALPDAEPDEEAVSVSDAEIVSEAAASQVVDAPVPHVEPDDRDDDELFEGRHSEAILTEPRDALEAGPRQALLIDDDVDPAEFEQGESTAGPHVEGAAPGIDQRLADQLAEQRLEQQLAAELEEEIEQLSDTDLEDADEHTYAGSFPIEPSSPHDFERHAYATQPAVHELAERLDAHLAEAEVEADADLGFDRGAMAPAPEDPVPQYAQESYAEEPVPQYAHEPYEDAAALEPVEELAEEIEEIDEFEILAEADADDADLLTADGEADASGQHSLVELARPEEVTPLPLPDLPAPPPEPEPPPRASHSDFAARLELSDEHPAFVDDPLAGFSGPESHSGLTPYDRPSEDSMELDAPAYPPPPAFPPPHAFDQSDVRHASAPAFDESDLPSHASPKYLRTPARAAPVPAPVRAVDDLDLESALEALDVDLDDLSIPHTRITASPPPPARSPTPAAGAPLRAARPAPSPAPLRTVQPPAPIRPAPSPAPLAPAPIRQAPPPAAGRPPRAVSEDGILIDFDDDD